MYIKSASPKSLSDLDAKYGWNAPDTEVDLRDMIQEFQGLRFSYFAVTSTGSYLVSLKGSGGVTHPSSQICADDVIFGAFTTIWSTDSGVVSLSMRNDIRIAATAGNISISGTPDSGAQCFLLWFDKTGYSAY